MRLARSSSAIANEHAATAASKKAETFMRFPPDLIIVLDTQQRRVNVFVVQIDDAAIDCHETPRVYSQ
jgi:hypothetical protein